MRLLSVLVWTFTTEKTFFVRVIDIWVCCLYLLLLFCAIESLPGLNSVTRAEFMTLITSRGSEFVHQSIRGFQTLLIHFKNFYFLMKKLIFQLSETHVTQSHSKSENLYNLGHYRFTSQKHDDWKGGAVAWCV